MFLKGNRGCVALCDIVAVVKVMRSETLYIERIDVILKSGVTITLSKPAKIEDAQEEYVRLETEFQAYRSVQPDRTVDERTPYNDGRPNCQG